MTDKSSETRPKKSRRALRACDFCSQRSIKCQPSEGDSSRCENCDDYGQACTYDRPMRKRGAKPKNERTRQQYSCDVKDPNYNHGKSTSISSLGSVTKTLLQEPVAVPASGPSKPAEILADGGAKGCVTSPSGWQPKFVASQAVIMDLAEVYFEIVGPVFPLFHRPSLIRRVSRCEYWTDRPFYASVMAMCAVVSARIRDGCLYSTTWDRSSLLATSSETFFDAAQTAIPERAPLSHTYDFSYTRAFALLAVTSIQYGKQSHFHFWLGAYHNCISVGSLYDEDKWPSGLDPVEIEERRRLFWSMYTLDVFTSVIWGGIVRSRESSCNVSYPTPVNDESFDKHGYRDPASGASVNWLTGWNFVTDLYRILEHAQDEFRSLRAHDRRTPFVRAAFPASPASQTAVLDQVMRAYAELPAIFKTTRPITCKIEEDLFSFQAANIAATVQLVRMVLFTTKLSTVDEKCQIAREVIGGFASVPNAYLRAISVPLLHHLATIGTILGAAFEEALSQSSYQMVRSVILSLANLLANLEIDLCCPAGTSDKLRSQVSRIDDYMNNQRLQAQAITLSLSNDSGSGFGKPNAGTSYLSPISMRSNNYYTDQSPQFTVPPELLKDWSWTFDIDNF